MNDTKRRDDESPMDIVIGLLGIGFITLLVASLIGWVLGYSVLWLLAGAGVLLLVAVLCGPVMLLTAEYSKETRRRRKPGDPYPWEDGYEEN